MKHTKKLTTIRHNDRGHWVGDGFPVRSAFSYSDKSLDLSPFLLLDYAGPVTFKPTTERLGVGSHPHRGFETVTIVYKGEVEHRDSSGGGGKIGPGDVQWMTAGAGIIHEEFHGRDFAKRGGEFEMIQLWVNLPAKFKTTPPKYQNILSSQIPKIELPAGQGEARIIAGKLNNSTGPAKTFSPVELWDLNLNASAHVELPLANNSTAALFVLSGQIKFSVGETARAASIAVFDKEGDTLEFDVLENSKVLLMSGEPLNEPVVGSGPFVMNTEAEIVKAFSDFRAGKMGQILRY